MDEFGNEPVVPYALLPNFAEWTREGRMSLAHAKPVHDHFIAVLPVLISFENAATRKSYPSLDKLAKLAGVSPTSAKEVLDINSARSGHPNGWWQILKKPISHGRTKHIYQMLYARYAGGDSPDWIRVATSVFHRGVWAIMTPATKRVYLVLRAHGQFEEQAEDGISRPVELVAGVQATGVFVPAAYWATGYLVKATGLASRTVSEAKAWLIGNGLAYATDNDQEEGVMMPFDPQRKCDKVLASIAATQKRNQVRGIAPASGHAKRDIQRLRKAQIGGKVSTSRKGAATQSVSTDAA